jgi:crotonobetainyl-CoA:carnitine CoA-transferase CaiB-like acyl-CoA transferase
VATPAGALVGHEPSLPAQVCASHLALLGVEAGGLELAIAGSEGGELEAQALSGLMAVNGRAWGQPRPVGFEVCSVAAGILAATGLLAALVANRRGAAVRRVETSMLSAALCFLRHHLAIATCGAPLPARLTSPGHGAAFVSSDGQPVELDFIHQRSWAGFWLELGAERDDVGRGWLPFAFRYNFATCALPAGLARVASSRTLNGLLESAAKHEVGLRTVRADAEPRWRDLPPWRLEGLLPCGRRAAGTAGPLPLDGIHLVEATTRVQGPLAGRLLQMLGATVTRIEPPGGDPARTVPPAAGGSGATFVAYNDGKRAVEIDYKTPAGRGLLAELVAGADVFLHNWPHGRAEKLGLEPAALARHSASLVCCHAAGWPGGSEEADAMGTDTLVQAHLGLATGERPYTSQVTIVDVLGGLVACEGVLAGLLLRESTGRGWAIETSLASAAMTVQGHREVDGTAAADATTDLTALPSHPLVSPHLTPGPGGCWLPGSPWRFAS